MSLLAVGRGFALADARPERALGPALLWAAKQSIDELHVIVDDPAVAAVLARRAAAFVRSPSVWSVSGRELVPAEAAPLAPAASLPDDLSTFIAVIRAAGAEEVFEHGVLRAEVLGLEVGRVVKGEDGALRLEVGVGRNDRWARGEMHGHGDVLNALQEAVHFVLQHRTPESFHPLAQAATERWLRCVVVEHPDLVGAAHLTPVPSPIDRPGLRLPAPAPAVGASLDGQRLVVVCSTGIDIDLVPVAVDARLAADPGAELRLVVPEGDDHPVTRGILAELRDPGDLVTVARDWRRLSPRNPFTL